MIVDFVIIVDYFDMVCVNVDFVVEVWEFIENMDLGVKVKGGFGVWFGFFEVDLFFDVDGIVGVVVDFVCDVCGLGLDGVYLVDKGDCVDGEVVDGDFGFVVVGFGVVDLFDSYWVEVFVDCVLLWGIDVSLGV